MWRRIAGIGLVVITVILLSVPIASGGTRTISWNAVTQYTDNTTIESGNTPVTYDVWFVDSVSLARTTVATGISATSATFDDSALVKGRTYNFYGKAYTKDGSASADSSPYSWTRPFQVPKAPSGVTITP